MIHFYMRKDGKEIKVSRQMVLSRKGQTTISKILQRSDTFPIDNSFIGYNNPVVAFMYTAIQKIIRERIIPRFNVDIKNIRVEFPEWVL